MNNGDYCNRREAKEILKVSDSTLRNYYKANKITVVSTGTGQFRYYKPSLYKLVGINLPIETQKKSAVCYARVSSKKQSNDLERQLQFFREKYPNHELVYDIASGLNWDRKGLRSILERTMSGGISEVIIAHRDRLCRFGFELLEFIFKKNDVQLYVLNKTTSDETTDLSEDIMSIIHVYSCRQMDTGRYSKETKDTNGGETNSSLSQPETIESDENMVPYSESSL